MKRALCEESGRVAQVVPVGEEFPVALPLVWRDCGDDIVAECCWLSGPEVFQPPRPSEFHYWDNGALQWSLDVAKQADRDRLVAIDAGINGATYGSLQPATRAQLKAMTNQEIADWFNANFTNQAQLLAWARLITRIVVRRLL